MNCLAAHMAEVVDIQCNKVTLIPAHVKHCGKAWLHIPATIHTFAPGSLLSASQSIFKDLDIQQRYRSIGSWAWQKEGMLKTQWKGLAKRTIELMTAHPHLPCLVAFDTFIGNNDRGTPNLFYDEATDSFCGIDMGNAYGQNLCKEAVCGLLRLYRDAYTFSMQEIDALRLYKKH